MTISSLFWFSKQDKYKGRTEIVNRALSLYVGNSLLPVNLGPLWGLYLYQDQRQESAEASMQKEGKATLDYLCFI